MFFSVSDPELRTSLNMLTLTNMGLHALYWASNISWYPTQTHVPKMSSKTLN